MVRIEDMPSEYSEGKLKFNFEHNKEQIEIELSPEISDINKLRFIQSKVEAKEVEERDLNEQTKVLTDIIDKSYPDKKTSWARSIAMRYGNKILLELYFELGWRDREQFEKMKKMQEEAFKKIEKKMKEEGKPNEEP